MDRPDTLQVTPSGDAELVIERTFGAPIEQVFAAMTRADAVRQWMTGPPGWTVTESTFDLRVGGSWRVAWQGAEGEQMAMAGTYREIDAPRRVVHTECFEMGCEPQSGEQLVTFELAPSEGDPAATQVRTVISYPSADARDATLATGMEQGLAASYANLDALLAGFGVA